jgi:transcriptional regulator with XRE-family HTH domain
MMPKRIDPVDIRVGRRVRAYRLSRGMSQTALGSEIGVTFQQIQKYERGVNRIGSGRLKKIATILEAPIAALFGEDEKADAGADRLLTDVLSQPYATRLLRAFEGIKDVGLRRALMLLAESMADGKK